MLGEHPFHPCCFNMTKVCLSHPIGLHWEYRVSKVSFHIHAAKMSSNRENLRVLRNSVA